MSDKLRAALQAHEPEKYHLRWGCKCGWGTALGGGYDDWIEHIAAIALPAEPPESLQAAVALLRIDAKNLRKIGRTYETESANAIELVCDALTTAEPSSGPSQPERSAFEKSAPATAGKLEELLALPKVMRDYGNALDRGLGTNGWDKGFAKGTQWCAERLDAALTRLAGGNP